MSEYQYYEFQAIDRPLDRAAQQALRSISSRARITATSFINHYEWGDLKGDPRKFMEQWFDLHLYVSNWGLRRLMMRLPKRFLSEAGIAPFIDALDWVEARTAGDNLIIDIGRDEREADDEWDDGSGWLASLAPLRADVLAGDLRPFYLLWLAAVQDELVADDELEPLPGIGPLTGALEAFADFFDVDPDLVRAAAESGSDDAPTSRSNLREAVAAISERDKTELLLRLIEGEPHVVAELKTRVCGKGSTPSASHRTVRTLRARAQEIQEAREQAIARRQEKERRRQAAEAEKALRTRLEALKQRGTRAWDEVEREIERRNPAGYERAMSLLADLQVLAGEERNEEDFSRRVASIRAKHEKKGRFIERLRGLGVTQIALVLPTAPDRVL
jgi:hypothetical protein